MTDTNDRERRIADAIDKLDHWACEYGNSSTAENKRQRDAAHDILTALMRSAPGAGLRELRAEIVNDWTSPPAPTPGSMADHWYRRFVAKIDRILAKPEPAPRLPPTTEIVYEERDVWVCKVGWAGRSSLPSGSDSPMRKAVWEAFLALTGHEPKFCFSGWGGSLEECELAVVENREPEPAPPAPPAPMALSSRDWTEDASHENGSYQCRCITCGESFVGHKRRVVCRACWKPAPPAPDNNTTPMGGHGDPQKDSASREVVADSHQQKSPGLRIQGAPGSGAAGTAGSIPASGSISPSAPDAEARIAEWLGCAKRGFYMPYDYAHEKGAALMRSLASTVAERDAEIARLREQLATAKGTRVQTVTQTGEHFCETQCEERKRLQKALDYEGESSLSHLSNSMEWKSQRDEARDENAALRSSRDDFVDWVFRIQQEVQKGDGGMGDSDLPGRIASFVVQIEALRKERDRFKTVAFQAQNAAIDLAKQLDAARADANAIAVRELEASMKRIAGDALIMTAHESGEDRAARKAYNQGCLNHVSILRGRIAALRQPEKPDEPYGLSLSAGARMTDADRAEVDALKSKAFHAATPYTAAEQSLLTDAVQAPVGEREGDAVLRAWLDAYNKTPHLPSLDRLFLAELCRRALGEGGR